MLVEWITVITILLIVGILLDGWRRMRSNRYGSIKMAAKVERAENARDEAESYGAELPNGGARVVCVRSRDESEELNKSVREALVERKTTASFSARIPEQVSLNLEESVPMLMDVDDTVPALDEPNSSEVQIETAEDLPINDSEFTSPDQGQSEAEISVAEREQSSVPVRPDELMADESGSRCEPHFSVTMGDDIDASVPQASATEQAPPEPDEVIIMHVMARKGARFNGEALMNVLLDCDLRFGDMNIFHRHAEEDGQGPVLFSMVNMIKPGTFSLKDMRTFETPGVSLFMTLPMAGDPMNAFTAMAQTAHQLQKSLGAELKDENRSVMTLQTLEHCREKICEYQRKNRLKHAVV